MLENKKLKEEFCVFFDVLGTKNKFLTSNFEEEEKLVKNYENFIKDIKEILKENGFEEDKIKLFSDNIFINFPNTTLKEMPSILKCLTYIQILAIEKYKFLLKGVVEYLTVSNEKDFEYPMIMLGESIKKANKAIVEDFSQSLIKIFDEYYIDYLSVYYGNNDEDDFFNIMLKHKKFIKRKLIENSKEFYKIIGTSGKRILEKQFFYKEFESRKYRILERLEHVKKLHNLEEIKKQKNYLLEFEKDLKKQEEDFSQTKEKLNDNEKNILKIREKYLYLLNYHNKIVFSLIKFGAYKEDRRRSCSINLEEII